VGKTSLVTRYVKSTFDPPKTHSTIGASFLTKRVIDIDTGTVVRLQIWDTAGQERFRSISKLYYRGASAVILVYSILDEQSFLEMGVWLQEIKKNLTDDVIVHVVGTKSDVVAADPSLRGVPFERCIAYVAEHFRPASAGTPPVTAAGTGYGFVQSGDSKRSSGFWGQDAGWDICHEISASSGEGIEEVFRVITRKLVEQKTKRLDQEHALKSGNTSNIEGGQSGYFDRRADGGTGSFRVGVGDKRRSWLGFPTPNVGIAEEPQTDDVRIKRKANGRCC
jgi:small GTP-binding protein